MRMYSYRNDQYSISPPLPASLISYPFNVAETYSAAKKGLNKSTDFSEISESASEFVMVSSRGRKIKIICHPVMTK